MKKIAFTDIHEHLQFNYKNTNHKLYQYLIM